VDIESLNHYAEAVAGGEAPDDVLRALRTMGRDNARTPMQWDAGPHAGLHHRRAVDPGQRELPHHQRRGGGGGRPTRSFPHYRRADRAAPQRAGGRARGLHDAAAGRRAQSTRSRPAVSTTSCCARQLLGGRRRRSRSTTRAASSCSGTTGRGRAGRAAGRGRRGSAAAAENRRREADARLRRFPAGRFDADRHRDARMAPPGAPPSTGAAGRGSRARRSCSATVPGAGSRRATSRR
jgi:hypothetical protein